MSMKEISSSVEATEVEAEKVLEEAKARANEILHKGREEARRIISSELPLTEVRAECDEIARKANAEAAQIIARSEKEASEISADIDKKIAGIVDRMVSIIRGAKAS